MAAIVDNNITGSGFVGTHPAMSWRSTVAGLLISLFSFGILLSLGVALGGVSLTDGASLRTSGIVGGLWLLFSVLLSLFAGSYFSSRISNFSSNWAGMAQGAVLAALFIGIVLWQFVSLASLITRTAGSLVGSAAQGIAQVGPQAAQGASSAMNLGINDIIEDNLQGIQFRGEPTTVISGVGSRLLRGNPDSAKRYLAANSNLTVAEVNQRIDQLQVQVQQATQDAQVAAAGALKITGWSLFGLMVLGLIVAIAGGVMGAVANRDEPAVGATLPGFRPATT